MIIARECHVRVERPVTRVGESADATLVAPVIETYRRSAYDDTERVIRRLARTQNISCKITSTDDMGLNQSRQVRTEWALYARRRSI